VVARLRAAFRRHVLARPWAAFIVMGVAFLLFGLCSLDLVHVLVANGRFLVDYGWKAVLDGGLWQLLGLLVDGYAAMAAYVVMKSCEHALTDWLSGDPHA
jgi:hypothetical protein